MQNSDPLQATSERDLSRRIEEASLNAWPAMQQVLLDGWVLRFSKGFTKRANSIVPLYPGTSHDEERILEKIRYCENLYAREQLRTVFRLISIVDNEPLDRLLLDRGYEHADSSEVLAAPLLSSSSRPPISAPTYAVSFVAVDEWLNAYCALTGMDEPARSLHGYILKSIGGECGYAVVKDETAPVACGLAVLEHELVGFFDIYTHAEHRQRGIARQLVQALMDWGAEGGATTAYLQVVADNTPAISLYEGLGFKSQYRYWYRMAN